VKTDLAFSDAVERVRSLLKAQGFGVLCEIDVQRTLREKTGKEFRPYVILGACNPTLASRALEGEPQLGLLLPCNIVMQSDHDGTLVSAVSVQALLSIVRNEALAEVAADVDARLGSVLDGVMTTRTERSASLGKN
jgi:uncharacterized protein (DUF302 family)